MERTIKCFHACLDWDGMPIDERDVGFGACTCDFSDMGVSKERVAYLKDVNECVQNYFFNILGRPWSSRPGQYTDVYDMIRERYDDGLILYPWEY